MAINILTTEQIKKQIAEHAKQRRLEKNLSRASLEEKSGIPASTIKHFETTGKVSLDALLAIAMVLDFLAEFAQLFAPKPLASLKHFPKSRERGRQ